MPAVVKPCNGAFSLETIQTLRSNLGRAQWHLHTCVICGQEVEGREALGRWSPDLHWPSIPPRPSIRSQTTPRKVRVYA